VQEAVAEGSPKPAVRRFRGWRGKQITRGRSCRSFTRYSAGRTGRRIWWISLRKPSNVAPDRGWGMVPLTWPQPRLSGHSGSTVNDPTSLHLPIRRLSRWIVLFRAPFAVLAWAYAGESCAAVLGQTWLCHHFFPT